MVMIATKAGFSAALGAFVMGSLLAETVEAEKIAHIVPVSYTHLDVYKRQIKREATPKVDKVDVVPQGWGNPVEVFEHALELSLIHI